MTPEQLHILKEEVARGKLFSLPNKIRFMHERNMKDLEEVHEWMKQTRTKFENLVMSLDSGEKE